MVKNGSLVLALLAVAAQSVLAAPYCVCDSEYPALAVEETPDIGLEANVGTYQQCAAICDGTTGCNIALLRNFSGDCVLYDVDFARNGQTGQYIFDGTFAAQGDCASYGIDPSAAGSVCFDYDTALTPTGRARRRALTANQRRRAAAALGVF